jgi:hypothetical protein
MFNKSILTNTEVQLAQADAGNEAALQHPVPQPPDLSGIEIVEINPQRPVTDYQAAMKLANTEAGNHLGDYMLLSWYDRDRNFESPQHVSERHLDSAVPGYVDYGIYHGATLKVDVENGRFVYFYMPVDL